MNNPINRIPNPFRRDLLSAGAALVVILTCLTGRPAAGADAAELGEKTKAAVEDAGRSVADGAGKLLDRFDEARLKHRSRDEVIAWVIMGLLVAAAAGMMTPLRPTGFGNLGRILLGLGGAFLGGMVVRVARLDFNWGSAVIRYEELLASLVGAILLFVIFRLVRPRSVKKAPTP